MKPLKYDPEDMNLAVRWLEHAKTVMPSQQGWTEEGFAEDIAKVRAKIAINHQGMEEVFNFIIGDKFWEDAAVSPGGLLKKSGMSGLRKIDHIISQMTKGMRKQVKVATMANSEDPF